ncbi:hypothetical protein M405DRAFT_937913 [Rhizopogon salebrosus TDB-379]|nr:hypothetical protein M405DRAFT_937913 [Rhizopogon salebrosus TDB-379]
MGAKGKLICSYPGPAIAVPNAVVGDSAFIAELANFLVHMDQDVLEDAAATRTKAKTTVIEDRDTTHPRYITELLTGILRGLGNIADVPRIRKRIGDDVLWDGAKLPWRRSPLWLVIRVALQTTLERNALGRTTYKSFMLFFMARLTKLALDDDMSNDTLHFMSAKMARRLFKLGPSELSHMINEVTGEVRGVLEERWGSVQDAHQASPPWCPETLCVLQDTHLSLKTSQGYIRHALHNQHSSSLPTFFEPSHHARGTLNDFLDTDASFLVASHSAEPSLALADFETVIASGIDHWVACVSPKTTESACISIEACASAYSSRAMSASKGNPESLSIMLITLLELWVAMDKVVTGQIPLLADYSPEIPLTLLERLLVRKSSALDRVKRLHAYLKARHRKARGALSAFSSTINDRSFAVRYFYESSKLRHLKLAIEADARKERERKKNELQACNQRYAELQKSVEALSHQYTYTSRGQERHKTKRCPKCRLEKELQSMSIVVHEWPLPARGEDAIVVVFELACPIAFDLWRSTTFHILVDICTPGDISRIHPHKTLPQYDALKRYRECHPRAKERITLASDAKPFTNCHYSHTRIPTTEDKVCVNNGLVFRLFDTTTDRWAAGLLSHCDPSKLCTFLLPEGPYYGLQRYLTETSHASNEVIANQADCHKDLQWMNVLRELRARTLNFRRAEVHLLLAQAVSQVGPISSDEELLWHEELHDMSFINTLFGELESLTASVEGNWLEGVTISTIVMLVCRALSSTWEESIKSRGYSLLRRIRSATFALLMQLSAKMQANSDETVSRQELQDRIRDMAFTCRSTFDLDRDASALWTSSDDAEIFAYCAIMIYDNTPSKLDDLPQHSQLLLERDKRCSHALEAAVRRRAELYEEGLDCAVAMIWGSYRQGTSWRALPAPNSRWLVSHTTPSTASSQSQQTAPVEDGATSYIPINTL